MEKSVAFVLVGFAASRSLLLFVVERKGKSFKVELSTNSLKISIFFLVVNIW